MSLPFVEEGETSENLTQSIHTPSFHTYGDLFAETWKAFSDYDIIHLKTYDSKRVCFKDAIFSLLPRMRHGLFYNTPLISECHTEGMLRAFSQHVLHRLHIPQDRPKVGGSSFF
ncbi:unnamed protein product [Boreogadus saida]